MPSLGIMQRKRLLYWIVQFTGWTAYFLFSILLLASSESFVLTTNLYIYAFLSLAAAILISHGIRFVIIRRSLLTQSISNLVSTTLLMAIIAGFALETAQLFYEWIIEVDFVIDREEEEEIFQWATFLFAVSRSIILFLVWCGFYIVFGIVERARSQEILNLKWEASKNEIELKNLRAQLNPHFLFNSLNSIRALVGLNPAEAKTSITQLSTLLRRSINLGKMRIIPLKDELELVKIYLELEKTRFEERLSIDFEVDTNSLSAEIPPLMVQTIVENGIKHGISKAIDGGTIRVQTKMIEQQLELVISNSGKLDKDIQGDGIGIQNTKKRLSILYGEKAKFSIKEAQGNVIVTIQIQY